MRLLHTGFHHERERVVEKNPHPTAEEVKHACAGNLCRCGTHPHIMRAVFQAAGVAASGLTKTEVMDYA